MDLNALQQRLLAAARMQPPNGRVPLAFEKRILARLADRPVSDPWVFWVRGLWRAAASCAALCLVLGGWMLLNPPLNGSEAEFSQQFENTVFAAVDQEADSTW
jgi:hypothetical protein